MESAADSEARSLRVLVIDDSENDAELIMLELRRLSRSVEIVRVWDEATLRAAISAQSFDAILCDWHLPGFGAIEALGVVAELQLDLPFIILSGVVGEDVVVKGMRAGAHDYVLKDRMTRLVPALERELHDHRQRGERKAAEAERARLASTLERESLERQRTEGALRASETRFARLSDAGVIGIAIGDLYGALLECNDTQAKMLGFAREEIRSGKLRMSDLMPPPYRTEMQDVLTRLREGIASPPWESELIQQDGTRVPVLIGIALLEYPEWIAFVVDLSARRRAEDALRKSEEQVRQMQKMDAIGSLAGGVAHDFNNVLSVILSYSELLAMGLPPGDPVRADLEEIRTAGRRAANLTQQLLMFSRQQTFRPTALDLNETLANMDKMLRRIIGEDITLVTLPSSTLGRVLCDPNHIEQVVMNLVANARDAMPSGGQLTIETENVMLGADYASEHLGVVPGAYVRLAITDSGEGMSKATQARIFEPFFSTKDLGKGTGLGLSTVFGIVKQSGGTIWVYSELRFGTTFKVYFPRTDRSAVASAPPKSVPPPHKLGRETVLLVEDEDQVRTVARGILRRHGYTVLEASNAGEALLFCDDCTRKIDLLLTDVVMPQMGGPQLAERLKRTRPELKVLCMSGYTDDAVVRHGMLKANLAFLQKPFTPHSLASKVREVLDTEVERVP